MQILWKELHMQHTVPSGQWTHQSGKVTHYFHYLINICMFV